jgi:hypothetical protein
MRPKCSFVGDFFAQLVYSNIQVVATSFVSLFTAVYRQCQLKGPVDGVVYIDRAHENNFRPIEPQIEVLKDHGVVIVLLTWLKLVDL